MQALSQLFDFKSLSVEEKVTAGIASDCISSLDFAFSTGCRKSNTVKHTFHIKIIHYPFLKHFKCLKGLTAFKKNQTHLIKAWQLILLKPAEIFIILKKTIGLEASSQKPGPYQVPARLKKEKQTNRKPPSKPQTSFPTSQATIIQSSSGRLTRHNLRNSKPVPLVVFRFFQV